MQEEWRRLGPGDKVTVSKPISLVERGLLGRSFTLDRITKPHGFAVVTDEHGSWHVHPECLQREA